MKNGLNWFLVGLMLFMTACGDDGDGGSSEPNDTDTDSENGTEKTDTDKTPSNSDTEKNDSENDSEEKGACVYKPADF